LENIDRKFVQKKERERAEMKVRNMIGGVIKKYKNTK